MRVNPFMSCGKDLKPYNSSQLMKFRINYFWNASTGVWAPKIDNG